MADEIVKTAEIRLQVSLDENNIPIEMKWKSDDNPANEGFQGVKAIFLSMLDPETLDTLKIDLWTNKLEIQEMDRFLFQTLRSMANSYQTATGNTELANEMQKFAQFFGEQTKIIDPES